LGPFLSQATPATSTHSLSPRQEQGGNLFPARTIFMSMDEMSACLPAGWVAGDNGLRDNDLRTDGSRVTEATSLMTVTPVGELIRRGKQGDPGAFEEIYERFKAPLFGLALRHTGDRSAAEDILQDTFIKVLTHLGDVRNEETFPAWVFRIAVNTCYSHLRGRRGRENRTVALSQVEGRREEAVYDAHETSLMGPLDEAIARLPEKLRMIFLLHDVQGFKHTEIGDMLGVSAGTSKSQLFKARLKMRKFLKAEKGLFPEVEP
jgi:RNA polymerase sigma-70 factor (ECF subfamily)